VRSSSVIDYLDSCSLTVAHYYFRFESEHAPYNQISWVLRALISQIARQREQYAELQMLYQTNRHKDTRTLCEDDWQNLLLKLCQKTAPVYFVFDGLDVPSDRDREDLVHFIRGFKPSGVRVLVTSRPIFTALTDTLEGCLVLDLRAPAEGLASFVASLLERKPSLPGGLLKKGYDLKNLARIIAKSTSSSMCVFRSFNLRLLNYLLSR
jgi:hypothetical protein